MSPTRIRASPCAILSAKAATSAMTPAPIMPSSRKHCRGMLTLEAPCGHRAEQPRAQRAVVDQPVGNGLKAVLAHETQIAPHRRRHEIGHTLLIEGHVEKIGILQGDQRFGGGDVEAFFEIAVVIIGIGEAATLQKLRRQRIAIEEHDFGPCDAGIDIAQY